MAKESERLSVFVSPLSKDEVMESSRKKRMHI